MGCSGSKTASGKTADSNAVPVEAETKAPAPAAPEGDYKVNIEREEDGASFGVSIVAMSDGTFKVTSVKEDGLIPAWNTKNVNTPEVCCKAGDFIVTVNGIFGDTTAMQEQLKGKSVTMALKRPTPSDAQPPVQVAPAAAEAAPAAEPAAEPPVAEELTTEAATAPAEKAPEESAPAADAAVVEDELLAAQTQSPRSPAAAEGGDELDTARVVDAPAEPAAARQATTRASMDVGMEQEVNVDASEMAGGGEDAKLCRMSIC